MNKIHKIAAMVIENDEFFMVRKKGKDIWTSLGGKVEGNETEEETLLREIKEEIDCEADILRKLGDFEDKAVFDDAIVRLSFYLVNLKGEIKLKDDELDECTFIDENYKEKGIKLPNSITKQVIPFCIEQKLLNWNRL